VADPNYPPPAQTRREGTNWRLWAIGAVVALLAIVALQNSQDVEVEILFIETSAPLFAILLIATAIGAAIGYLLPVLRRHRRAERRRDKEDG
jgi:uncharacterized integral membrane protein